MTTTSDTTTTRRGFQLVDRLDGSPASQIHDSREEVQRLHEILPESWDRSRFEVVECDPMPEPPAVPWATRVLVESPTTPGDPFLCEATVRVLDRDGLPGVAVEATYHLHPGGSWELVEGPSVLVWEERSDGTLIGADDARTFAGALVEAADRLADILAGGQ